MRIPERPSRPGCPGVTFPEHQGPLCVRESKWQHSDTVDPGASAVTLGMPFTNMMPILRRCFAWRATAPGLLTERLGIGSLLGALVVASVPRQHAHAPAGGLGAVVFGISVLCLWPVAFGLVVVACAFMSGVFVATYQTRTRRCCSFQCAATYPCHVVSFYLMAARPCRSARCCRRACCSSLRPRRRSNDELGALGSWSGFSTHPGTLRKSEAGGHVDTSVVVD